MKTRLIILLILSGIMTSCDSITTQEQASDQVSVSSLEGKWIRMGHSGSATLNLNTDNSWEVDLGNDSTIDFRGSYMVKGDTIHFMDKGDKACPEPGVYQILNTPYYTSFDLIDDMCGGRIKITMGFWTRPNYKDLLHQLDSNITNMPETRNYLDRARIYLAIGQMIDAQKDLDIYLATNKLNARAYINRASTQFPNDLGGVVDDCNKAITLDDTNKNAYFLRGLAYYGLGQQREGCEDFHKAIELGFSILKIAEEKKCAEYWEKGQSAE